MAAPTTATEARAAGFTRELFASSSVVDLELLVRPDVDLDGAFECFDLEAAELLVVSGWLFETFEDRDA